MKKLLFLFSALLLLSGSTFQSTASVIIPKSPMENKPDAATIKAAVETLKSLPRKERNEKLKKARKEIKSFKASKKAGSETDTNTLLLVILALLLPPLAVYLHQGETNNKFWITTLLFVLGILGAFTIGWYLILASIVYALIVILGNG
jgi:uncharacterized membrane protein YqaE (UPF0057 family)